jgi:hypothetical protein
VERPNPALITPDSDTPDNEANPMTYPPRPVPCAGPMTGGTGGDEPPVPAAGLTLHASPPDRQERRPVMTSAPDTSSVGQEATLLDPVAGPVTVRTVAADWAPGTCWWPVRWDMPDLVVDAARRSPIAPHTGLPAHGLPAHDWPDRSGRRDVRAARAEARR